MKSALAQVVLLSSAWLASTTVELTAGDILTCRVDGPEFDVAAADLEVGAISGDGQRILFTASADLSGQNPQRWVQIFSYDVPNGPLRQITAFQVDQAVAGRLDADAGLDNIVFASRADLSGENRDGRREIFHLRTADGRLVQLTRSPTSSPQGSRFPSISSDGELVSFLSNDDLLGLNGDGSTEVYLIELNGPSPKGRLSQISDVTPIHQLSRPKLDDFDRIVFVRRALFGAQELILFDIDSRTDTTLLEAPLLSDPFVSAASGRIAVTSRSDPTGGNPDGSVEVFVVSTSSPVQAVQVTSSTASATADSINPPSITADGNRVFFTSNLSLTGRNDSGFFQLFAYDFNTRSLVQITRPPGGVLVQQPAVSRNGRRVAFALSRDPSGQSPQAGRELRWAQCRTVLRPVLAFPQVAVGDGLAFETILTNSGDAAIEGTLSFFDDSGSPLRLNLGGESRSEFPFQIAGGGSWKLIGVDSGPLKIGYGLIHSDDGDDLSATLVFRFAQSEVSVPGVRPAATFHFFTEWNSDVTSGLALVNLAGRRLSVTISFLDTNGESLGERLIELESGQKLSRLVNELEPDLRRPFQGSIHVRSDDLMALVGLRVRLSDVALSTLSGASWALPAAGSGLLYLLDSGIDLRSMGFTGEALDTLSVSQLLQVPISQPARPHLLELRNTHPTSAVTVSFNYLNDRCRSLLTFLLTLECGQTLLFDPFDLTIPGTELNTHDRFFGSGTEPRPLTGAEFSSGRFVLWVSAVGASLNDDHQADLLFASELSPQTCQAETAQIGVATGARPGNLHLCNARPMTFNYLTGRRVGDPQGLCRGPVKLANAEIEQAFAPMLETATVSDGPLECLSLGTTPICRLPAILQRLGTRSCPSGPVTASAVLRYAPPLFNLQPR